MDTIHQEMDSGAEIISVLFDHIKVTITDVMVSQQREASKRFISETGMGRPIIQS